MLEFNIAGISFNVNRDAEIASLRPAGSVEFVAEPDNAYDENAVAVLYHGKQIGYVPKGYAQEVALRAGTGVVKEYTYKGDNEKYPPKGWNHEHDGVLGSITIAVEVDDERGGKVIGGKYMRVTTFIKYFDPYGGGDGLIKWAFDQSLDGLNAVVDLTNMEGSYLYDRYKRRLNETADDGTAMHEAIENFFKMGDRSDNLPAGWDAFVKKYSPEPLSMEQRFWDNELMVTGQYDFLGYINGTLTLVDWKSSKKPSEKHKIQASIYASNVKPKPEQCLIVAFGADNNQGFAASAVKRVDYESKYIAMRHLRKCIDACGIWIGDDKYYEQ